MQKFYYNLVDTLKSSITPSKEDRIQNGIKAIVDKLTTSYLDVDTQSSILIGALKQLNNVRTDQIEQTERLLMLLREDQQTLDKHI